MGGGRRCNLFYFSVFFFDQCNDALLVNEGKQNHRKTYPCICEYDCAAHVEGLKQAHCHSWLMAVKLQIFHGFDFLENWSWIWGFQKCEYG